MKKYLLILTLVALVVPSVTFASWWNPVSWFRKSTPTVQKEVFEPVEQPFAPKVTEKSVVKKQEQIVEKKAKPAPVIKNDSPKVENQQSQLVIPETWEQQEARDFAYANLKGWMSLTSTNALGEKRYYRKEGSQWIRKNTEAEAGQPLNTTLCNGQYWNNCPVGQQFYCPASGSAQCTLPVPTATPSYTSDYSSSPLQDTYVSLSRNKGVVVFSKSGCDYYLVETSLGYSLLEWYGGFFQDEGDIIYGNLNSYGFKDVTNSYGSSGRVWIDDWMLSKSRAIEKYYDKCD